MILVVLAAAIGCIIVGKLIKSLLTLFRQSQLLKKFPGPPIDNFILGHAKEILSSPAELAEIIGRRVKEYGGIYRLWVFSQPYLVLSSSEYAEMVFCMKELAMKGSIYSFLHVWLGLGLLTSQGQLWQQRRKLITPAFHFSILHNFSDVMIDNSQALVQKLKKMSEQGPINVFKIMHLVALDNICETAMGIKIDALNNPKTGYIKATEDATQAILLRMLRPWLWNDATYYYLMPAGRKLKKDLKTIFDFTSKVIKDRRAERRRMKNSTALKEPEYSPEEVYGGKKKHAFLDLLIEACESESVPLSDQDLLDEVNTFMVEGHDTAAVCLSFTSFILGLYPDVQRKCFEELDGIFESSDRRPTADDLSNMKYLEQVIRESLRLYPSVPVITRQAYKDTKLGELIIPEGSILSLDIFHLHRDPKYFPDPEKFDPERFSTENSTERHPFAYVPFAAGVRNCIGQRFAMMEIKIVLSFILRNFRLESVERLEDIEPAFELILRSEKNLNVKFIPR